MILLVDAGPFLNFLATNQQGLLLTLASAHNLTLAVPERVSVEVKGKSSSTRFKRSGAHRRWINLSGSRRIRVLDDSLTDDELVAAVARIGGAPASQRVRNEKDLGELMVIAHASVRARRGEDVFMVIDEWRGRLKADDEMKFLIRQGCRSRVELLSTPQVLRGAAAEGNLNGRWQDVYNAMRQYDDGLPPLD